MKVNTTILIIECRINLGEEISDAQLAIIELYEIKDTVFENEAKTNNTNEYSHDRISKLDKRISLVVTIS